MYAEALPWMEPAEVATRLHDLPGFVWLDSAGADHPSGRYSYFAIEPISRFRWPQVESSEDFDTAFRSWKSQFRAKPLKGGSPFQGGVIGYVSYDAASIWIHDFQSRHQPASNAVIEFALYDTVVAVDHATRSMTVYSAGLGGAGAAPDEILARGQMRRVAKLVCGETGAEVRRGGTEPAWSRAPRQPAYAELVNTVREEILDGEIYQANIASLWARSGPGHPFADYLRLRQRTEAALSAFGVFEGRILSSLSPERLVAMDADGHVRAEPIKGTTRRSPDPGRDRQLAEALAASEKDRAENIMIVDLLRNDLSRVCRPESVEVTRLCGVESLPNLHHLVSTIAAQLSLGRDAVDLLGAVFPGGSVTGAPKLRAMEIIDALEPSARGAFCGSFGYIGFDGACDFNIMIRTVDHLPDEERYWSGAGITLLSEANAEWEEVQLKAERILGREPTPQVPG
ncbi:anthranilate synthase component I family protein [Henriciella aquimarina]|uniref:anthranilate synthase component I family protein n=1 Tax=Henriciella aquimarina TaxID=545261 RepID=UPI001301A7A4|nr:anthranilate synthase component I family protein [Henriciella aquimarina]